MAQANKVSITADDKKARVEADLASAYRDLEGDITDARLQALVVDALMEDVFDYANAKAVAEGLLKIKWSDDHKTFLLNGQQAETLIFTVKQIVGMTHDLYAKFYERWDQAGKGEKPTG